MNEECWRYRCPEGHSGWERRVDDDYNRTPRSRYYCKTCQQNGDDPHFGELIDMKNPDPSHVDDPDVAAVP